MQAKRKHSFRKSWLVAVARVILIFVLLAVIVVCTVIVSASPAEVKEPTIYDVPLSDDLQLFIADLCEEHHMEPEIVLGVIEHESDFNASAVGDNGNSLGLMQIQPRWHKERMERLGCDDLLDPYQNVTVGVDILAELLDAYQDTERALIVYNAGAAGAYNGWFQYGVYSNSYSSGVLANATALNPKESGEEEMNVPDNYDVWLVHEEQTEKQLEQLPVCFHCEQPIQQETAVCLDGTFYCDECLELNRVEVGVD